MRIYELVGMKKSIEELKTTLKYDLQNNFHGNDKEINIVTPPIDCQEAEEKPCSSNQIIRLQLDNSNKDITKNKPLEELYPEDLTDKRLAEEESICSPTREEPISKEMEMEENFCSQITQLCDSVKSDDKELEISIRRVYRALEKGNELRAKKLKLQEQHYTFMEELRKKEVESKIEKDKKLIEIEEMKLKMLLFSRK